MVRTRADLYKYQDPLTVEFIKNNLNCAGWVPMGGGKTVSCLTAISDLMDNFEIHKALVLAPLRVARKVWTDEIEEWAHLKHLTTARIIGTEKQRLKALNTEADIHLINRENTVWLTEQFIQEKKQIRHWPWDTVILDEAQSYKNQSSKRWKALRRVRRLFPRLIELTGTPIPNGYEDLWAQIYLLDGGKRLGASEREFHERWFIEKRGDGYSTWYLKPGAAEEIQNAVKDIVLALRLEDYFDLPEVPFNPVRVALSAAALATYRKFERTYIAEFNGRTVSAASAGVCAGKLLQLANGHIYTQDGEFELFHDEKIDALIELLEGCSGPVVIGHSFRADAARIAQALDKYCRENGKKWKTADKDADLELFANGKLDYVVLHPASAGHGINSFYKSGANNVIWFGVPNNLEWFQQLNARLTGGLRLLGRFVVVHIIIADGTCEQRGYEQLTAKGSTQDGLTRALVRQA